MDAVGCDPKPKFCKDCKHFRSYESVEDAFYLRSFEALQLGSLRMCQHPSLVNLVSGCQRDRPAQEMRVDQVPELCGTRARFHEAGMPDTPGIREMERAEWAEHARRQREVDELRYSPIMVSPATEPPKAVKRWWAVFTRARPA